MSRAFAVASREKAARAHYATSTKGELATLIASAFPLDDAATDADAIATLAASLERLTKAELILFAQYAESWQWTAAIVTLARSMRDRDRGLCERPGRTAENWRWEARMPDKSHSRTHPRLALPGISLLDVHATGDRAIVVRYPGCCVEQVIPSTSEPPAFLHADSGCPIYRAFAEALLEERYA